MGKPAMWFFSKRSDINLIPEEEQALRTTRVRLITVVVLVALVGLELLVYLLLTGLQLREENTQDKIADEIQQKNAQWQEVASSAASLKVVKNKVNEYRSFANEYFVLEEYIKKVGNIVPTKVDLTDLMIDKDGETEVSGKAPSPADIFQFLNVLNKESEVFEAPLLISAGKISEGGYSFIIKFTVTSK